jgi:hypothetical protein
MVNVFNFDLSLFFNIKTTVMNTHSRRFDQGDKSISYFDIQFQNIKIRLENDSILP